MIWDSIKVSSDKIEILIKIMMNLVESNQKAEEITKLADLTPEEETNIRKKSESDLLYKCNPVLNEERGYYFWK
ncbi:hypothetical protein CN327_30350 [Bacillus cereus]|nr:hypothetical protein CON44_18620 [Bacillus cereus]PEE14607.1 hypothetical protein CON53_29505 [Bacillus cereus]PEQ36645.1 hypothetical protein CN467_17900 [Bacillus cereus]PER10704.1 hypothetical protein CN485_31400 [Bacillus cereus]PES66748.1 hypothetical protein CN509_29610 [Bacillus cereus]